MQVFQFIVLGIVQGLSEFLPVSSSAHLVLVPYILKWEIPADQAFIFDVLVQVATLAAVFAYFWADLNAIARCMILGLKLRQPFSDPMSRLGWLIVVATIPAGLAGLAVKDLVEQAFSSPRATAFFLLITAVLLVIAERVGYRSRSLQKMTWQDALWIGIFQAVAIFPGVSRSGATVAGGMMRDLERPAAARFSFLMSIPIMLAAGGLALGDMLQTPHLASILPTFIPGFVAAAVVGYLSIRWLIQFLTRHPLYVFSVYCTVLGVSILALTYLR